MAKKKANMLPSGNFRVRVLDHKDPVTGKYVYRSFTAPTRAEAELMARTYREGEKRPIEERITVKKAVDSYITIKTGVLSPATIKNYESYFRCYFDEINNLYLSQISSAVVQLWISNLSVTISAKTVKNAYSLLKATLDMFIPDTRIKVTLPKQKKVEIYCPSDSDVKAILEALRERGDKDMELAVLLGSFGLRRGEICALEDKDIKGNVVTVSKDMVLDSWGEWIVKPPKTFSSNRSVEMPQRVVELAKGRKGKLVPINPNEVTARFERLVRALGLPHFRFHDLRHYCCSILHAIGVPDKYIMQRGGWSSDYTMKTVYRNIIDEEQKKQTQVALNHFSAL